MGIISDNIGKIKDNIGISDDIFGKLNNMTGGITGNIREGITGGISTGIKSVKGIAGVVTGGVTGTGTNVNKQNTITKISKKETFEKDTPYTPSDINLQNHTNKFESPSQFPRTDSSYTDKKNAKTVAFTATSSRGNPITERELIPVKGGEPPRTRRSKDFNNTMFTEFPSPIKKKEERFNSSINDLSINTSVVRMNKQNEFIKIPNISAKLVNLDLSDNEDEEIIDALQNVDNNTQSYYKGHKIQDFSPGFQYMHLNSPYYKK